MDENSSLHRRYSFNLAQGNHTAESTHLNGSSFLWGSSVSPKHCSNSTICVNNTDTTSYSNNRSVVVSHKSKNNTKIDPRIVADVQSNGLASRIVKYHESGTRLNRSMSPYNLYTKPGQFPAVTLKKTNLPYRATKQELSMIRIPPPEKSSFYGNTIASLLRSSSVVGLQNKRSEDLSRENRPIIHPPPTENDLAPTRSVLEVLKEISRKRINSDDLDADEISKKYCNRDGDDFVDIGSNTSPASPNFTTSLSCQRYKRQRDCTTSHQSIQLTDQKTSPEQAKKRICNYNNDITSSLSSSIKCGNYGAAKRISESHNLSLTAPSNLESYEIQRSKLQRYPDQHNYKNNNQADVRFENLENTLKKVDVLKPITPIPPTPCEQDQQSCIEEVSPKQTSSELLDNTTTSKQPTSKPRLTLFNKKYDDENETDIETSTSVVESTEFLSDFVECAGIPFVKPKQISSISGMKNPAIERTQKSKLALMLSGLKGELYQNFDVDQLDSSKEKQKDEEVVKKSTNTSTTVSSTTTTVTTLTTVTSCSDTGITTASDKFNMPTNTKITSHQSTKAPSPLVGLKLSQKSSENISSTIKQDGTKNTVTSTNTNVPVLGGFSFGVSKTASSPLADSTQKSSNIVKDHKTSIATIASNSKNNSNTFTFGQSTQISSTSSSFDKSNKLNLNSSMQPSTIENTIQFPAVCTAFTLSTNSTSSHNTGSSIAAKSLNFETTAPALTSSTPNQAGSLTTLSKLGDQNNDLKSTVSSSAVTPTMFSTFVSATTPTITSSSSIASGSTSGLTFGIATTSTNFVGLTTSTSSFTFNSPKQSTTSETKIISSSSGNSLIPFTFGANLTAPSVPSFGTNTNATVKTQSTKPGFSFNSDSKNKNSPPVEQNKVSVAKQTELNIFDSNAPSTLYSSPSLITASSGESALMFGNGNNSSSTPTAIFGSTSVKVNNSMFGSTTDNKSVSLASSSLFGVGGSGSGNNNASTPFSFGSKPSTAQSLNTKNCNTPSVGFSFGSVTANSSENGSFAFSSKTSDTTNSSNNTNGATTSDMQNKNFTFGSSANKPDNRSNIFGGAVNTSTENKSSPGGFSFGSVTPKASAFSFGAGGNTFSGSNVSNTNSSASGFTFGGVTATKPNELSVNKPFAFGAPQQQQKQQMLVPNNNVQPSNVFGSSTSITPTPSPAFNFNSGSSTNAVTTNNIFAPPSSTITTGPGDRPIRRATRRLQK